MIAINPSIEKDGIELVDDVGGIYGFCRMLQTIYETDTGIEEDREESERYSKLLLKLREIFSGRSGLLVF